MEQQMTTQPAKHNFALIVILAALITGSGVYLWQKSSFNKILREQAQRARQEKESLQHQIAELQNQATYSQVESETPSPNFKGQIYENQYMKIVIPAGWTTTQATKTVYAGKCITKDNCVTIPKTEPNPAAVNITKGNYILYINTQSRQTSGVQGGRFSEIAMGAPSADAVIKTHPASPCGFSETYSAFDKYSRIDLYVNSQKAGLNCNTPSNGQTVWYFSYLTDNKGGFFNYYKDNESPGLVITVAYNSDDVNKLPRKGSVMLETMLNEITNMLKTLEIKQK